jgi:ABC-2 type transport system ATP-binding protein
MKQRLGIAQALLNRPRLLICDEPTSALDPVGRKEILDILLAAREQTTVLFSTHILSDVERICTDVALLDGGVLRLQGKLEEVKSRYRREIYRFETETNEGARALAAAFPCLSPEGERVLLLSESDRSHLDVLRFIAERRIPLLRMEREEPTLESLFLEVART